MHQNGSVYIVFRYFCRWVIGTQKRSEVVSKTGIDLQSFSECVMRSGQIDHYSICLETAEDLVLQTYPIAKGAVEVKLISTRAV